MFISSAYEYTKISYRISAAPLTCFYHSSRWQTATKYPNAIQGTVLSDVTMLSLTFALHVIQASLFRYVSNTMMQTGHNLHSLRYIYHRCEKSRNTPFSRPAPLWCRNAHSFLCINIHFHLYTQDTFSPPCAKQTIPNGGYLNLFRTF